MAGRGVVGAWLRGRESARARLRWAPRWVAPLQGLVGLSEVGRHFISAKGMQRNVPVMGTAEESEVGEHPLGLQGRTRQYDRFLDRILIRSACLPGLARCSGARRAHALPGPVLRAGSSRSKVWLYCHASTAV